MSFFDQNVSDQEIANRIWTMFVRNGFAPGAYVEDDEEDSDMGGRRITEEEIEEIDRLAKAGSSAREIGEAIERSPTCSAIVDAVKAHVKAPASTPAAPKPARSTPVAKAAKATPAPSSSLSTLRAERERLAKGIEALDVVIGMLEGR